MSYDEDPLDLLEDDGDGVIEMGLFLDEDTKEQSGSGSPQNSGCCVVLLISGCIFGLSTLGGMYFWG